ncbi:MaoC/PaaZ C-terminal domain-containing protein [uncultured Enterovirga sp.]|uniref:MaoC/PaaZ C-terminal domain-containing protein n=1 Tax=uncultured Enterovirga sp. TaxID=2026352 RepID=UPI0035CBCBB4
MADRKLDLDDLGVGQRFRSAGHLVTTEDIKRFAREFDPQPFHLDEEAAKSSFFGGLAASGWHTAAITMRLIVEDGFPIAGGIIGSGGELLWTKRSDRATRSRWRARSWTSRRPGLSPAGRPCWCGS